MAGASGNPFPVNVVRCGRIALAVLPFPPRAQAKLASYRSKVIWPSLQWPRSDGNSFRLQVTFVVPAEPLKLVDSRVRQVLRRPTLVLVCAVRPLLETGSGSGGCLQR